MSEQRPDPEEDLENAFRAIAPLPDKEKIEAVIKWFSDAIDGLTERQLRELRAGSVEKYPAGPMLDEFLMQIDGRLALLIAGATDG